MLEKEREYLLKIGFVKIFPDELDRDYFYLQKNVENPMFKNLHIIVDGSISVWVEDVDRKTDCLICQKDFSDKNISEIEFQFSYKKAKGREK